MVLRASVLAEPPSSPRSRRLIQHFEQDLRSLRRPCQLVAKASEQLNALPAPGLPPISRQCNNTKNRCFGLTPAMSQRLNSLYISWCAAMAGLQPSEHCETYREMQRDLCSAEARG